jgi:hypothetical protein
VSYSSEVLADSPASYARLGDASGSSSGTESSTNARAITYSNVTLGVAGAIAGDANTAGSFNGSSSKASITYGTSNGVGSTYTIEAWIKTSGAGAGIRHVAGWRGSITGTFAGYLYIEDNKPGFAVFNTGSSASVVLGPSTINDNQWHHVVGTIDGTTLRLYVDGTQVATAAMSGTVRPASSADFTIGSATASGREFAGSLDEVAHYTSALSAARITAHHQAAASPSMTLAGTVQRKTAAVALATVAAVALAGTVQAKTGAFTLEHPPPLTATLAGTVQPKTGTFALGAVAAASLDGTVQAKTGAFEMEASGPPEDTLILAGVVQPKTAVFEVATIAAASLAGVTQAKTGAFTLSTGDTATAVLDGTVQRKTAAFTLTAGEPGDPGVTVLTGTVQAKAATFVARTTIPIVPVPVHLRQHGPAPVVIGRALGPVTALAGPHGTQPVYSVSAAAIQRARQQIVVDGVDITFLRGVHTPDVTYTLLAPLRYGPGQLDLPQVIGGMEPLDEDSEDRALDLAWMWAGAPVEVNLVLDDPAGIAPLSMLMEGVYRGVLVAWDLDGVNVSVELGGEANGRASLRDRQPVVFPRVNDIGHQMSDAVRDLGLPVYPPLGTETGIEMMTTGGVGHIEHIQNLCAQAWTRNGKYWTIMPNAGGAYEVRRKSDTIRHATVFFDDARTVARLRRDIAEEPNRIFITGVTRNGQRVRFAVYPGLVQGPAPDFPGHLQAGDTGEGVRLLVRKLQQAKYLDLEDVAGGYDDDVVQAVKDLQDAAGLPKTGEVNQKTWDALYDLNVTGFSLIGAHIEPAAQDPRVRRVNRSANGTVLEFNDDYDPTVLPVDRTIDAGVGKTLSQYREFARTVLEAASAPNWVGDITFHTGALLRGERPADVVVTPEIVMDARELVPTMNLWAPRFEGGTQFNIAAAQVGDDGTVTATVDTRFRDALEVWDIIDRNKESRNDPARRRNMAARSSTIRKDSIGEWDWVGGVLGVDINLERGWNSFPVVGATEGQIRKARIALKTPAEFAWAVWGRKVTAQWLNTKIPKPLTVSGTKAWEDKHDELEAEGWLLFSRGTHAEPGGYWPGRKIYKSVTGREPNPDYNPDADENETGTDDDEYITVTTSEASGTLTGRDVDTAGFPYYSENRTTLWITVWVGAPNGIEAARILWPQLEAGA